VCVKCHITITHSLKDNGGLNGHGACLIAVYERKTCRDPLNERA